MSRKPAEPDAKDGLEVEVESIVERLLHCAQGHGNHRAFVRAYFRREIAGFVQREVDAAKDRGPR